MIGGSFSLSPKLNLHAFIDIISKFVFKQLHYCNVTLLRALVKVDWRLMEYL